jgi:hypothetical protein
MSDKPNKPIFIYNTPGDWQATAVGPYIFDSRGDYIGFLENGAAYTRDGEWVGDLSKDGRILRKRAGKKRPLHTNPLPNPGVKKSDLPGRAPLPPQNAELSYDTIDVLDEDPDVFKRVSEQRKDMGE